jgi:acyl-CoA synthetase (AMP-forming)/AMP-acid ligase II
LRTPEHNYLAYREKFAQKQANVEQQKLCARVCLRDGEAASIEEIRTFCQGQIARYKIPRYVKFVDGFPMTVNRQDPEISDAPTDDR